jgi:hypothetical protein
MDGLHHTGWPLDTLALQAPAVRRAMRALSASEP